MSTSTSISTNFDRSIPSTSFEHATTVAIIGCGPGGMSFLHALAMRRKTLEEQGDVEALARLPVVTCFERASSPGGVWRNNDFKNQNASTDVFKKSSNSSGTTNMYEGLWINCCKEAMEFKDYTFKDHFGESPLPVYLPRKLVLEYNLARVTSQEDIFQYVRFNTTVQSVIYDDVINQFVIVVVDNQTKETSTCRFDKCVWAGGLNGDPNFAPDIVDVLKKGKFRGQVVHSTDMGNLTSSVQGKRIVMVGDNYSAEDLALQCLKLGAERIYITTRKSAGMASYVGAWPGDRVEVLYYMMPDEVTSDGHGIICKDCRKSHSKSVEINDISIVIFCTGYQPNLNFLAPELKSWYTNWESPTWSVPKNWKMTKNSLSSTLGHVEPSAHLEGRSDYMVPELYRRLLIKNPNMMFLYEQTAHPILEIDVGAWLCLSYICGDVEIPTVEEMEKRNSLQLLQEMQEPWLRYDLDKNYGEKHAGIPWEHWFHDYGSDGYFKYVLEGNSYAGKVLARDMVTGNYPLKLGSYKKLNTAGEKLAYMTSKSSAARHRLTSGSADNSWRTFRDCDPSPFSSLITESKATFLQGRWMDIDNEGKNLTKVSTSRL